jgi:RHS repeat-associated protein
MPVSSATTTTYTVSPASEVLSMTSSLSNSTDPANLVSSVVNGPYGPTSYNLGNGLANAYTYDTLGRLNGGTLTSGGTTVYAFLNTWKGTQLQGSIDSVLGQTSTYGYDGFNRLASRTVTAGTVTNYAWVYDRWGNRWQQNVTAGSGPSFSQSFNTANNRLSTGGYLYDAAGNMTSDGTNTYTYDAEGNITAVSVGTSATYVYNASNQRVRTVANGATTEFVFNAGGQRVSEWNGTTRAQLKGKYYWGGRPVAYYTTAASGSAGAHFEHQDWLGTERMRTTYNSGNNPTYAVEGQFTSQPWGDAQTPTANGTDASHYATLDHDAETETDHAQFRQYSNEQGHFMSPDPYGGSYDLSNPQSMNRYVYALNNPLSAVDPSGLDCVWQNEDGSTGFSRGDCSNTGPGANGTYINCDGCVNSSNVGNVNWDSDGDMTGFCISAGQCYDSDGDPMFDDDPNNDSILKHWPLNGNLWPGYTKQDGVCTTGPLADPMNSNPGIKACCATHDACYTKSLLSGLNEIVARQAYRHV